MTNAQETNVKQEPLSEQAFLDTLINLCDDLAWGRPASEDRLFALTKEGAGPKNYVRLAEAFGMMLVKVEAREFALEQRIAELADARRQLEHSLAIEATENSRMKRDLRRQFSHSGIVGSSAAVREMLRQVELQGTSLTALQKQMPDLTVSVFALERGAPLDGVTFLESTLRQTANITVVAVKRDKEVFAHPGGDFRLQAGDLVYVFSTPADAALAEQLFAAGRG